MFWIIPRQSQPSHKHKGSHLNFLRNLRWNFHPSEEDCDRTHTNLTTQRLQAQFWCCQWEATSPPGPAHSTTLARPGPQMPTMSVGPSCQQSQVVRLSATTALGGSHFGCSRSLAHPHSRKATAASQAAMLPAVHVPLNLSVVTWQWKL